MTSRKRPAFGDVARGGGDGLFIGHIQRGTRQADDLAKAPARAQSLDQRRANAAGRADDHGEPARWKGKVRHPSDIG